MFFCFRCLDKVLDNLSLTLDNSKLRSEIVIDFNTKFDVPVFKTEESAHARHILCSYKATDTDAVKTEKKALAEKCRKELVGGADFAELAKKHSDCPSKQKGGDLGTFSRGQMVKTFEDAAFTQKIKDIGPVVESRFGYHVIQVLERSEAGSKPMAEAKPKILKHLNDQKKQGLMKTYVDGLRAKAEIKYADPSMAPSPAPAAPTSAPAPHFAPGVDHSGHNH